MERIQIIGNLGQDAQVATVQNGDETARFSVGVNHKYKDSSGTTKETTTWYNATIWKPNNVKNFLKKGQQVLIEGRPRVRIYDNRNGEKVASIDITVANIELLGKAPEAATTNTGTTAPPSPTPDDADPFTTNAQGDGDLPF
jgi:single-strand DNA-binding protein